MRSIRFGLDTIAQWPNRTFGDHSRRARVLATYHIVLISIIGLQSINIAWYSIKYRETIEFIDLGQSYANFIMDCLFLQRSILPLQKKYCETVEKFCSEFHLLHHEYKSDFAEQTTRKVNKLCKTFTKIVQIQVYFGVMAYNLVPLFRNIQAGMFSGQVPENKTFEHCVDYVLPFDAYTDLRGYIVIFIWNLFPTYNIPTSAIFYDLLIFVMVFHISGHLEILSHTLKHFPRQSVKERSMEEYNEEVFAVLKDVIRHYQMIKEFMTDMSEAFDLTICFYLAFHQLMCCLLLLECSTMEPAALGKYAMLITVVFQQLIETSVVFEIIHSKVDSLECCCKLYSLKCSCYATFKRPVKRAVKTEMTIPTDSSRRYRRPIGCNNILAIGQQSDKLTEEVYALPWEQMDVKNRRIVLLFLRNVQNPLSMKACGMVPVGVLTMSTIIRTSFSYYLMLATLAD